MMHSKHNINKETLPKPIKNRLGVHPDVIKLGFVSLLTDLSSEMIFSVFAIFLRPLLVLPLPCWA